MKKNEKEETQKGNTKLIAIVNQLNDLEENIFDKQPTSAFIWLTVYVYVYVTQYYDCA